MKRLDLGMVVKYNGRLAEVVGIAEGRTISLRYVREELCPTCGRGATVSHLEHAPIMQDALEPVSTIIGER